MVGKSKPMQDLYLLLDKIRQSDSTILIQGENGTGKELFAKAIHFNGPRKGNQFVTINCSAFNENLLKANCSVMSKEPLLCNQGQERPV